MFLLFLSYTGFMEKKNNTVFLRSDYLLEAYIKENLNYRKSFPWYIPVAEFCGGILGSGISLGASIMCWLYNYTTIEHPDVYIDIAACILFFSSYPTLTSLGIWYVGHKLGHKGSYLLTFLGCLALPTLEYCISPLFKNWKWTRQEPQYVIILLVSVPIGGTIGYQINSSYNRIR